MQKMYINGQWITGQKMGQLGLEGYTKIKQVNVSLETRPAEFF